MMRFATVSLVGLAIVAQACSDVEATPAVTPNATSRSVDVAAIASDGLLPAGAYVLPGRMASDLFDHCSRDMPPIGQSTWQPNAADIALLEAALPAALVADPAARAGEYANWPAGWVRQYVGIMRGSTRAIYGNFTPASIARTVPIDLSEEPIIICDGGPEHFGVEFDPATRRFTHLASNG